MNKKEAMDKSIQLCQERINQVDAKLKDQSLSNLQRTMYESEKTIATEELAKIQAAK
ncbi:hypothetical protein [Candidatus Nitrosotalea okcheonensis]|uniref:hypothetical protein n=1 Tax=Candidatus Nitrosotalea okcheonensis TaxID=1903276 RepID=UPI0013000AC9|nr:hypothetical protein [Candidatus Nitrosotalea okcheonensis]MDE1728979.1 hypothetical protein [Nitrososphaerota archaeon]MDE1877132.1 hypothetical protein [Nitrososphaerota archaeon]